MVKRAASELQQEIKQRVPFRSLREELWLNLSRTSAMLVHSLEQHLRPYGLSPTQYNVLRILRGAETGLCQYDIRNRLVAQVPDVPRILDRMEKAGWVKRERGASDRRVVISSLTEEGSRLLDVLEAPLTAIMEGMFPHLDEAEMATLNELLVEARRGSACAAEAEGAGGE